MRKLTIKFNETCRVIEKDISTFSSSEYSKSETFDSKEMNQPRPKGRITKINNNIINYNDGIVRETISEDISKNNLKSSSDKPRSKIIKNSNKDICDIVKNSFIPNPFSPEIDNKIKENEKSENNNEEVNNEIEEIHKEIDKYMKNMDKSENSEQKNNAKDIF